MKINIALLSAALLMMPTATTAAPAEPAVSDPSIKPTAPTLPLATQGTGLLESFGGKEGLTRIMDDVMLRWLANPKTRPFFEGSDQDRIKKQLVEQFCVVMNGPCTYSGRTMAEAHKGMAVTEGSFYALVEELQISLNKAKVPFFAQNRLIAALAPMHRDIIDK